MEEQTKDTKVKTMRELQEDAQVAMDDLAIAYTEYDITQSPTADDEQRFNAGRYGRQMLDAIDTTQHALTQLRMHLDIKMKGRDSARAKQLDRILGIAEDVEAREGESTFQERVTDMRAYEIDDDGGETT